MELLGHGLRLASHVAVSGSFFINGIAEFQAVFDGFRPQVEQRVYLLRNLSVAQADMAASLSIDVDVHRACHTDGIADLH